MGNAYALLGARQRGIYRHRPDQHSSEKQKKCSRAKCISCCKSFTAFLFSTIGLVLLVVAYSTAGGFIFKELEEGKERDDVNDGRLKASNATKELVTRLWNIQFLYQDLYRQNWTSETEKALLEYQIYDFTTNHNWDGRRVDEEIELKWNFAGALLYSITAITTIGYGHVTPKTPQGQFITMAYCVLGVPLTLMCIANLGKFFSKVFRVLYHTCCCGICCICCLAYRRRRMVEKLSNGGSRRSTAANLEKLGNGKTLSISNDPDRVDSGKSIDLKISLSKAQVWLMTVRKKFSRSLRDDVTVPIYLSLVVIGVYILAGAMMFSLYEQWTYREAAYFCFVSVTTIGFGDYIPGIQRKGEGRDSDYQLRLVLCGLYLFLGLSLVGMCIDLMQADVLYKFRWIAQKIGILGKDGDNDDLDLNATHGGRSKDTDSIRRNDNEYDESHLLLAGDVEASPQMRYIDMNNKPRVTINEGTIDSKYTSDTKTKSKKKKKSDDSAKNTSSSSQKKFTRSDSGLSKKSFQLIDGEFYETDFSDEESRPVEKSSKASKKESKKQKGKPPKKQKDLELPEIESVPMSSPPPYNAIHTTEQSSLSSPERSHYDELPGRVNTTPLHRRLEDVEMHDPFVTDILPAPDEYSGCNSPAEPPRKGILVKSGSQGSQLGTLTHEDEILSRIIQETILSNDNTLVREQPRDFLDSTDCDEALLTVSRTSNV